MTTEVNFNVLRRNDVIEQGQVLERGKKNLVGPLAPSWTKSFQLRINTYKGIVRKRGWRNAHSKEEISRKILSIKNKRKLEKMCILIIIVVVFKY